MPGSTNWRSVQFRHNELTIVCVSCKRSLQGIFFFQLNGLLYSECYTGCSSSYRKAGVIMVMAFACRILKHIAIEQSLGVGKNISRFPCNSTARVSKELAWMEKDTDVVSGVAYRRKFEQLEASTSAVLTGKSFPVISWSRDLSTRAGYS